MNYSKEVFSELWINYHFINISPVRLPASQPVADWLVPILYGPRFHIFWGNWEWEGNRRTVIFYENIRLRHTRSTGMEKTEMLFSSFKTLGNNKSIENWFSCNPHCFWSIFYNMFCWSIGGYEDCLNVSNFIYLTSKSLNHKLCIIA